MVGYALPFRCTLLYECVLSFVGDCMGEGSFVHLNMKQQCSWPLEQQPSATASTPCP